MGVEPQAGAKENPEVRTQCHPSRVLPHINILYFGVTMTPKGMSSVIKRFNIGVLRLHARQPPVTEVAAGIRHVSMIPLMRQPRNRCHQEANMLSPISVTPTVSIALRHHLWSPTRISEVAYNKSVVKGAFGAGLSSELRIVQSTSPSYHQHFPSPLVQVMAYRFGPI